MIQEQLIEILDYYTDVLEGRGCMSVRHPNTLKESCRKDRINHVLWMCEEVKEIASKGNLDKAYRWLGFIQGCAWDFGLFSIDEMRDHNRQN